MPITSLAQSKTSFYTRVELSLFWYFCRQAQLELGTLRRYTYEFAEIKSSLNKNHQLHSSILPIIRRHLFKSFVHCNDEVFGVFFGTASAWISCRDLRMVSQSCHWVWTASHPHRSLLKNTPKVVNRIEVKRGLEPHHVSPLLYL